ncbi:hypothetical protein NUW58_g960 [Xylaria curta]|uniref:Uncharacterized protein n=2 Tax=Xylaria curta TaxID=42375 RepID=A0ACC1P911_9PEZI|nr:hypothetical protein NUW58_g3843 [Xylaria curta]KAJ2996490.1 hypothetical protein NUW58_g960 [Xylaria curta]
MRGWAMGRHAPSSDSTTLFNYTSMRVMAGLEVAGLVLGGLPLAVKAVQGYRETFYSIKNVQRDLGYIERDLETEKLRLQNVCETLLIGIVPPNKINSMIEQPFGPEWKSYASQLAMTLDDIVFMVAGGNRTDHPSCPFYQPFVVKTVPSIPAPQAGTPPTTPASTTQTPYQGRPINLPVLSLGALLLQVIIGRVENGLGMADALDIYSIVSKRERGSQLEEVLVSGGMNYAAAVKWCLDSVYGVAGLNNDRFCQKFHEEVVGRDVVIMPKWGRGHEHAENAATRIEDPYGFVPYPKTSPL